MRRLLCHSHCQDAAGSAESSKADNSATDGKVYNIGICQLVQHEALDAATKGFKDYLTEKLGADNVKFDEQNAQGDSATCATICNQFVLQTMTLFSATVLPHFRQHTRQHRIFRFSVLQSQTTAQRLTSLIGTAFRYECSVQQTLLRLISRRQCSRSFSRCKECRNPLLFG